MIFIWIIIVTTVSAILWYCYMNDMRKYGHIPGPWKLPLLGNMHLLQKKNSQGKQLPLSEIATAWGRKYGPVMWINLSLDNIVILGDFDTIYEALVKKGADFASRPNSYCVIASGDDKCMGQMDFSETFKAYKAIAQHAVKVYGDGIQSMQKIINESLDDLVDDLCKEQGQAIHVKDKLRSAFGNTIFILVFGGQIDTSGTTYSSLSKLMDYAVAVWEPSIAGIIMDSFPFTRYLFRETYRKTMLYKSMRDQFWKEQLQLHKDGWDGEQRCLLDVLLKEQKLDGSGTVFSDEFIMCNLAQLFIAGVVTSTTLMTGLVLIWLHNPLLQKKLFAEVCSVVGETGVVSIGHMQQMHYTQAHIFEALRYFSINPFGLFHKTAVDTSVGGFPVPKGTTVAANLWALHHDPRFWDDPWSFIPERFLEADDTLVSIEHPSRKRLLPFGTGHRVCAAEHFALNRLFLFVTTLVQRFHIEPEFPGAVLPSHDPRTWQFSLTIKDPFFKARFISRN